MPGPPGHCFGCGAAAPKTVTARLSAGWAARRCRLMAGKEREWVRLCPDCHDRGVWPGPVGTMRVPSSVGYDLQRLERAHRIGT